MNDQGPIIDDKVEEIPVTTLILYKKHGVHVPLKLNLNDKYLFLGYEEYLDSRNSVGFLHRRCEEELKRFQSF